MLLISEQPEAQEMGKRLAAVVAPFLMPRQYAERSGSGLPLSDRIAVPETGAGLKT